MEDDSKIHLNNNLSNTLTYVHEQQSMTSLPYDQKKLESISFERCMKQKQGKLFTEEPDYLKGMGLHGDGDDNQMVGTVNTSPHQICEQNISAQGQRQSQSQFMEEGEEMNNHDEQKFEQSLNRIEIHANDLLQNSGSRIKQMTSSQFRSTSNFDAMNNSINFQNDPRNDKHNRIQSKIQETMKVNQIENIYENITSNTSANNNSRYASQSIQLGAPKKNGTSKSGQNEINAPNKRKMSTKLQLNVKSNHKLVEKMIDVQMAKNIIYSVINKSSNRQNRIKMLTIEFINKLKELSINRKWCYLSENEYDLINDQVVYYSRNKNSDASFTCQLFNKLTKINQYIPKISVFNPTDMILIIWDSFITFFTYCFLYIFSILLFFDYDHTESYFILLIQIVASVLFLLDIILNFNISFYNTDNIITDRKLIAKKYIKSNLIFDLTSVAVLMLRINFQNTSLQYNPDHSLIIYSKNLLLFTKLLPINEKKKRIYDVMIFDESQKHFLKLVSLIIFIIIIAHCVGTLWYIFAVIETYNGIDRTWVQVLRLEETPYFTRYIYSVYWTVTTMCTIGYGDITPANQYESLFSTISMIFLSCVFAYSINNIGMIMQEIEKNSQTLRDEINTFQRKKVNFELKNRVRNYLKFLSDQQKDRDKEKEEQILNKLSNKLRDEVTTEINTTILNKYQLFSNQFSKQTLNKMVFAMKEVLISPNEIIFKDSDLDDQAIYFIQDGVVEIFHPIQRKSQPQLRIKILSKNDYFGEISFFSGSFRSASARSLNLSTLYKITRSDFLQIVKQNQNDFEKFKMIQDKIQILKDLSCIQIKCYLCQKSNHLAFSCPNIHQRFDQQCIVLKNAYSLDQARHQLKRKQKSKQNTRILIAKNQAYIAQIRENYESYNSIIQLTLQEESELEQQEQNSSQSSSEIFEVGEQSSFLKQQPLISYQLSQHSNKGVSSDPFLKYQQQEEGSILSAQESNVLPDSLLSNEIKDSTDNKRSLSKRIKSTLNHSTSNQSGGLSFSTYLNYQQIINDMWRFFMRNPRQILQKIRNKKLDKLYLIDQTNSLEYFTSFRSMNTNLYKKTQTINSHNTKKVTFDQSSKSDEENFDKSEKSSPNKDKESINPQKSIQTLNIPEQIEAPQVNHLGQGICTLESYNTISLNEPQKSLKEQSSLQLQYQSSLNTQNYYTTTKLSKQSNQHLPSFNTIFGVKSQLNQQSQGKQIPHPLQTLDSNLNRSDTMEQLKQYKQKQSQEQSTIMDLLLDVSKSIKKDRQYKYGSEKGDLRLIVFDTIRSYKYYFPHNNFEKIMHEYRVRRKEQQLIDLILKKNQNAHHHSHRSRRSHKMCQESLNQQQRVSCADDISLNQSWRMTPVKLNYGVCINKEKMYPTKLEL